MKLSKSQSGFSPIAIPLILLALGIISFTGWKVYSTQEMADNDNAQENLAVSNPLMVSPEDEKSIPDGYMEYENKEQGFKFAYPSAVGELSSVNVSENNQIILYLNSTQHAGTITENTDGALYVSISKKADFSVGAFKYGPTIKPVGADGASLWQVAETNPATASTYKIGDTYDIKIAKQTGKLTIFDLSSDDEGCHSTRWIFEAKNAWVEIGLPAVCAEGIDTILQERLDNYKKEVTKILNTIDIEI